MSVPSTGAYAATEHVSTILAATNASVPGALSMWQAVEMGV